MLSLASTEVATAYSKVEWQFFQRMRAFYFL